MENVLLIEDRTYRQRNLLGTKLTELNNYNLLKNISGGEEFTHLKEQMLKKEYSIFDKYSTILFHRSAFDADVRNGIIEYLKNYNKKVVLFSGGITGAQLNKINSSEFMLINVTEFYSDNLLYFMENGADNLLELAFGKNWEISILLDSIQKVTLYAKRFEKKPWDIVEGELNLHDIIIDKYFSELTSKFITVEDLGYVLTKMNLDLKSNL